jgi:hypothetical protein
MSCVCVCGLCARARVCVCVQRVLLLYDGIHYGMYSGDCRRHH